MADRPQRRGRYRVDHKDVMVSVRVPEDTWRAIEEKSRAAGVTRSEWLRGVLQDATGTTERPPWWHQPTDPEGNPAGTQYHIADLYAELERLDD